MWSWARGGRGHKVVIRYRGVVVIKYAKVLGGGARPGRSLSES